MPPQFFVLALSRGLGEFTVLSSWRGRTQGLQGLPRHRPRTKRRRMITANGSCARSMLAFQLLEAYRPEDDRNTTSLPNLVLLCNSSEALPRLLQVPDRCERSQAWLPTSLVDGHSHQLTPNHCDCTMSSKVQGRRSLACNQDHCELMDSSTAFGELGIGPKLPLIFQVPRHPERK